MVAAPAASSSARARESSSTWSSPARAKPRAAAAKAARPRASPAASISAWATPASGIEQAAARCHARSALRSGKAAASASWTSRRSAGLAPW